MNTVQRAAVSRAQNALAMIGLSEQETKRYSLLRATAAAHFGREKKDVWNAAAFERECSEAVATNLGRTNVSGILVPTEVLRRPLGDAATRAMGTGADTRGGYLVGVDNIGFAEVLRQRSVAYRMGARSLVGLKNNVAMPRQTGTVSVTWQAADGTSVSAADLALGQLSLSQKTCMALTDVSEQLLLMLDTNADDIFSVDLASAAAIALDAAVINGTGGAQPLGIKNTSGVTIGQDTSTATLAKILALPSTVGAANGLRGRPGFVTNTAGAVALMSRQKFTGSSTALWEGSPFDGELVGIPAMSSEQLAASNLIFGCWEEIIIGEWGVLEIDTNRGGTRFNAAQVGIRALWMVDVLVRYPQSFVVSTNLS